MSQSGIRLGRGDKRPERGRVSKAPGRPSPACVWLCRLLRAGAHAVGGPQPCGLTAPRGEGRGSLGGGWKVRAAALSARLLLRWGKAVSIQLSENQAADNAELPSLPAPFRQSHPFPRVSGQPQRPLLSPRRAAHLWESGPATRRGTCGAAGLAAERRACPCAPPRASGQSPGWF